MVAWSSALNLKGRIPGLVSYSLGPVHERQYPVWLLTRPVPSLDWESWADSWLRLGEPWRCGCPWVLNMVLFHSCPTPFPCSDSWPSWTKQLSSPQLAAVFLPWSQLSMGQIPWIWAKLSCFSVTISDVVSSNTGILYQRSCIIAMTTWSCGLETCRAGLWKECGRCQSVLERAPERWFWQILGQGTDRDVDSKHQAQKRPTGDKDSSDSCIRGSVCDRNVFYILPMPMFTLQWTSGGGL